MNWNFDFGKIAKKIGLAAIILLVYLFAVLPVLSGLVNTQGILIAYPIFIAVLAGFVYLFSKYLIKTKKLFFIFLFAFLLGDVIMPPQMIPFAGTSVLTAEQQLAGDVFFYTIGTTSLHLEHLVAWFFAYLIMPLVLIGLIMYELKNEHLSKVVPMVVA